MERKKRGREISKMVVNYFEVGAIAYGAYKLIKGRPSEKFRAAVLITGATIFRFGQVRNSNVRFWKGERSGPPASFTQPRP